MTQDQALNRGITKIAIGFTIFILSFISFLVTMLKGLYFNAQNNQTLLQGLNKVIQNFVAGIYEKTQFLGLFWEHSPSLHIPIFNSDNLILVIIYYSLIGLGIILVNSGKNLLRRRKKVMQSIEDRHMYHSMHNFSNEKAQMHYHTMIDNESQFNKFHTLYLAPLIIAILSAVIIKLF